MKAWRKQGSTLSKTVEEWTQWLREMDMLEWMCSQESLEGFLCPKPCARGSGPSITKKLRNGYTLWVKLMTDDKITELVLGSNGDDRTLR